MVRCIYYPILRGNTTNSDIDDDKVYQALGMIKTSLLEQGRTKTTIFLFADTPIELMIYKRQHGKGNVADDVKRRRDSTRDTHSGILNKQPTNQPTLG